MIGYERPALPEQTWRDADGAPIDYGHRWGQGSPPDDSYSRTSNLERFAPLQTLADALIAWLAAEYDVDVEDGASVVAALEDTGAGVVRAVRVSPRSPLSAPLTFVFTGFPGVNVHAGVLHEAWAPTCGCDACDEDVEYLAQEMEGLVQAVVAGSFAEEVSGRRVEYLISTPEGGSGGVLEESDAPRERVAAAAERLRALEEAGGTRLARIGARDEGSIAAWHPWPRRR